MKTKNKEKVLKEARSKEKRNIKKKYVYNVQGNRMTILITDFSVKQYKKKKQNNTLRVETKQVKTRGQIIILIQIKQPSNMKLK